jgi:hypothetical protein
MTKTLAALAVLLVVGCAAPPEMPEEFGSMVRVSPAYTVLIPPFPFCQQVEDQRILPNGGELVARCASPKEKQ